RPLPRRRGSAQAPRVQPAGHHPGEAGEVLPRHHLLPGRAVHRHDQDALRLALLPGGLPAGALHHGRRLPDLL
ncbi:unnamed protein product, partial [Heterosigma akashiwo]